jgi:hypothetical protein
MNKFLIALMILASVSANYIDAQVLNVKKAVTVVDTDSGEASSVVVPYKAGARVVVWSVYGSGTAAAAVAIQKADETGMTASYTTIANLETAITGTMHGTNMAPIFLGELNYSYKFIRSGATANNVIVTYTHE